MKKVFISILFLSAVTLSYFYGLMSHKHRLPPFPQLMYLKEHLMPETIGFRDTAGRKEVPCGDIRGGRTMVALAFGQSNSGNHGETLYTPKKAVFNFFNGRCYRAADPLLGATGDGGSVWTRLGDLLIGRGLYDRVVIIPIGVGTTTIDQWTTGGYLHRRIVKAIEQSRACGLEITHLFWVQGGSEPRTRGDRANREHYKKCFRDMLGSIRDKGVKAPVYLGIATYTDTGPIPDIEDALRGLADPGKKIYVGADNDILYEDPENHWERVHLSHRGLELCSKAWLEAIRRVEKK
ncbi:MAG TPA: sialate O-acetylesterase [Spirochaetota bacterium]|nr:sialate O-acetylesterase [Spirochaetota bacterium]HPC42568.1 sialate O-acetylesterase [Spirochaetota bacterium]HPL15522.1 sialate O-acetylesterase [Spirochaetota bacterium]HQF10144.1 sialate O-acetylesterase [Spirochaetota bacterium]HQH98928.1 sialate O-acetylesterase [Spirochaetota bacterium]